MENSILKRLLKNLKNGKELKIVILLEKLQEIKTVCGIRQFGQNLKDTVITRKRNIIL